jgi:hypothetical protein
MKKRLVVVPVPLHVADDGKNTVLGDRLFEALLEGVVRVNMEYMQRSAEVIYGPNFPTNRNGADMMSEEFSPYCLHPYQDNLEIVYNFDPYCGDFKLDGKTYPMNELWGTQITAVQRKTEDCESLSAWLAAWYRVRLGVHASVAIYPSVIGSTFVGRHVCVFVPLRDHPYEQVPWDNEPGKKCFIRRMSEGGYIEDPSMALGMNYIVRDAKLPERKELIFKGGLDIMSAPDHLVIKNVEFDE